MKSERIFDAMGSIDENFIAQSEAHARKTPVWVKYGAMAACLALVVAIGSWVTLTKPKPAVDPTADSETQIVVDKSGNVVSNFDSKIQGSYVTPENGKYYKTIDVTAALKNYAGKDVTYFLAIDIFKDRQQLSIETDGAEINREMERLNALGYRVGYAKNWTYAGAAGEKVPYMLIAGYFTAEQLDSFAAGENYGYFFRFGNNGDGSPLDADAGIVTNFETWAK